ncbi:uncharacterized protein I206_102064 [Kwoniella pini CBS 10737]|uniref:FYVE-type domain-containing protein n=1 Tax=Kwoniella pini CBS 10737 TaxID=1296096 RepID=A0A1B9HUX3_9TREE|nr:uncharacterized protein I206_06843 [Kwoniella pini CBS 10737]OCF47069.1 hypothetical protein I206_06843 [Kwoniella pini CBS 10737]
MSITPNLPQLTTTPPPADLNPPRRRFGSFNSSNPNKPNGNNRNNRPSSSSSNHSNSSSTALVPPPISVQRTRSTSSASSTGSGGNTLTNSPFIPQQSHGQQGGPPAFDIGLAADKAQQWLSTWAPRGEGRSREFLANTLNGVANVASQVSNNLNRDGFGSRSNSFASNSGQAPVIIPPTESQGSNTSTSNSPEDTRYGSAFGLSVSPSPSPGPGNTFTLPQAPSINHTTSTPALVTKKILQPANLARLGHSNSTTSAPTTNSTSALTVGIGKMSNSPNSSSIPGGLPRTTSSNLASTSTTNLHGPSHLNPNASSSSVPSGHRRNSSTASTSHRRTSSFGIATLSRSSSITKTNTNMKSAGMPYKVGFQPQGVRHDRTEEFMQARKATGEDREREEGRLGRRWAKLVDLHFNPTVPLPTSNVPTLTRSSSSTFSISSLTGSGNDKRRSLLSIDGALDALKPKEVWKGFKNSGPGGEEGKKRAAEQAIVKWEDDNEVKKCRICQSSFSLSNRKHHCRLCGKIVCSLPPTPPALLAVQIQLFAPANPDATTTTSQGGLPPGTRREKCSLLLVADWKTGRGEEVEEGFVGWMKMDDQTPGQEQQILKNNIDSRSSRIRKGRASTNSISSINEYEEENGNGEKRGIPLPQQPKEVQVKGCRVCRECWAVVSRKQKMQDRQRVTGFARLYSALRGLQGDIEELMPEFENQLADLTESDNPLEPSTETLQTHKALLTLLTQYEHLSKRIGNLHCDEGSSQAVVQSAVARSAAAFLAREMVKLQTLQKLQKRAANAKRKSMRIHELSLSDSLNGSLDGSGSTTPTSELEREVEDIAVILQPLLEQEAQLETYISDANAQRKYEDSKALNEALKEIKLEIERITQRTSTATIR